VLRDHKTAIGWTIADIKGISPSVCMHRILMKKKYKPSASTPLEPSNKGSGKKKSVETS